MQHTHQLSVCIQARTIHACGRCDSGTILHRPFYYTVPQSVPQVVSAIEILFLSTNYDTTIYDVWVTGNNKSRQVSMKLCSNRGGVRANIVHPPGSIRCPEFSPSKVNK